MSKQQTGGERHWYAIHTYAGYENAVARNLRQRIDSLNMQDKIFNVLVPTETKIKVKGGKRVEEEEKVYPGYILVDMIVTDDSWFVVRNTPRVTGFVGSGVHPVPLTQKEIDQLMGRMDTAEVKHEINLSPDDAVKIADGPFKDMEGKVAEVDTERGKVKVLVSMFGRETPVELDFLQVKKLKCVFRLPGIASPRARAGIHFLRFNPGSRVHSRRLKCPRTTGIRNTCHLLEISIIYSPLWQRK
jgi:transcription termination/antitermination protein NusG